MNNTDTNAPLSSDGDTGLIKTPKQLIVTVILAFIVPIAVILLLVNLVATSSRMGAGADTYNPESTAARIQPVAGFKLVDASAPKEMKTGEQVFESTCAACHTSGVAGAPKLGDNAAWAPYIDAGYEDLIKNAIHGIGAMPPKGGNPTLSDFEVERAVVYIVNKSGASFPEPAQPEAEGAGDETKSAAAQQPQAAAPAAAATATAPTASAASASPAAAQQNAQAPSTPAGNNAEPEKTPAADAQAATNQTEAPAAATATAAVDPAGEKLYKAVCFACHTTGVANSPKLGDKAAWAPYIETGFDAMVQNAIHGVGAMPPRGGSQASDTEIAAAVQYMVDAVK